MNIKLNNNSKNKIKSKIRICLILLAIMTVTLTPIFAASDTTIEYGNITTKYKILVDGEVYTMPDLIIYDDEYVQYLTNFHTNLTNLSNSSDAINFTENGELSVNNIFLSGIVAEYIPIISEYGIKEQNVDSVILDKQFKTHYLLQYKKANLESYKAQREATEDEELILDLDTIISNYEEDISILENIDLSDITSPKRIFCTMPYLTRNIVNKKVSIDSNTNTVTENFIVDYYLYSIIYRDLRLDSIEYSINSGESMTLDSFSKDIYTYDIALPSTVAKDAVIKTNSKAYMQQLLEINNLTEEYELDLSIQEDEITLENGKGTAIIKVIFDTSKYPTLESTDTLERTYTLNYTVADYLKGDMNGDGKINAQDASIVLDKYKYDNATQEDIKIGDMDNNGKLNATDASQIIDIYKKVN